MSDPWIDRWLDDVVSGKATMSQRMLTSIEAHGGLQCLVLTARDRGVHLVQFTDDRGVDLVVASLNPFRALC